MKVNIDMQTLLGSTAFPAPPAAAYVFFPHPGKALCFAVLLASGGGAPEGSVQALQVSLLTAVLEKGFWGQASLAAPARRYARSKGMEPPDAGSLLPEKHGKAMRCNFGFQDLLRVPRASMGLAARSSEAGGFGDQAFSSSALVSAWPTWDPLFTYR